MRPSAILLGLLALGACAQPAPPDHVFPIFFTQFSSSLDAPAQDIVARAAAAAKRTPTMTVYVAGYADRNGAPGDAVQLSKARADAVTELLVADGVPRSKIVRTAVGTPPDSQPGVESRRVEIDIGI
jgi:outer membrane protein OmpA-like peptidoglycan-associated protein